MITFLEPELLVAVGVLAGDVVDLPGVVRHPVQLHHWLRCQGVDDQVPIRVAYRGESVPAGDHVIAGQRRLGGKRPDVLTVQFRVRHAEQIQQGRHQVVVLHPEADLMAPGDVGVVDPPIDVRVVGVRTRGGLAEAPLVPQLGAVVGEHADQGVAQGP